ncbi:MAG: hypothetical protein QN187_09575 [Armatimonadota bacterium]|nr:hypothetical protein [Armatimonadota bacterium]MDR7519795.1 hypothetical protein [Armatimonadota bacterium]MDR7549560.1 hypothetical protein [Armatimonadota bacterium]
MAEAHALIITRLGAQVARGRLQTLPVPKGPVSEADSAQGRRIVHRHGDNSYSLTDAMSFVVMEFFGARLAVAFDVHFDQQGFQRLLP